MDEKTVRALNAINRGFYEDLAGNFLATRREPWPGWQPLAALVDEALAREPLDVLDVGCGNGRFGAFLAEALPARRASLRYSGVDASAPMLAALETRRLPFAAVETHRFDVVTAPIADCFGTRRFTLIVLFGLLHHVPSEQRRNELIHSLAGILAPAGLLAFAVWRFEAFERFRAKRRPWQAWNDAACDPIDLAELEPGDHLLPWGEDGRAVRYCHFVDNAEAERLLRATGLPVAASYVADGREGRLNRYFVLRARGEP